MCSAKPLHFGLLGGEPSMHGRPGSGSMADVLMCSRRLRCRPQHGQVATFGDATDAIDAKSPPPCTPPPVKSATVAFATPVFGARLCEPVLCLSSPTQVWHAHSLSAQNS